MHKRIKNLEIVIESYCSLLQRTKNLSQSSTTQCELTTVFVETWYGRNENLIHVARTRYVKGDRGKFTLRIHHVLSVFTRFSSRMYYVLSALRPCYGFFKHVQNSVTSLKSFKTIIRPYQFALRFRCVVEVFGRFTYFFAIFNERSVNLVLSVTGVLHVI